MKRFFSPNIETKGRVLRGLLAVGLFAGAGFAFGQSRALAVLLAISAAFVLYEALRGWCALRACGIRTKF